MPKSLSTRREIILRLFGWPSKQSQGIVIDLLGHDAEMLQLEDRRHI